MYFILASSLIMFQAHFSELIEKHLSLKNLLESLVCNFVLCGNKITFSQISNYLNQMYIPKSTMQLALFIYLYFQISTLQYITPTSSQIGLLNARQRGTSFFYINFHVRCSMQQIQNKNRLLNVQ